MSPDLRDQLQTTLGSSYALEHELGGGGMSRVFAASETALGRKVVIKVLPPELAEGVSVDRFKREIQLAAQLQHAHIVPLLAAGESSGLPYYTMPLVVGHSLRTLLVKGGPLPITETISILRDVAKALAYAHEHGVVHRDIKPDNVLLSGGAAVVTDFGVAKALSASKKQAPGGTLTQLGSSLGTPAYMAPEQAAADPETDYRADIYAFGVMAYEMLAGRPPFHGRTPQKLLAAQMAERPQPIGELRDELPPPLSQLVMRCLEKEPDHRPQSAAELVRVLETVTSGGGMPAMPEILLGGRRRLWRSLALYALAFGAVTIVAKAAIIAIGLPDWVFPGALLVMAMGLPVILFTAFVHHGAHQALTASAMTPGGTPVIESTMTRIAVRASRWVSWRKTAIGGVIAVSVFVMLVLGFMTLRALGIGPAGSLLAAGKFTDKEQLLVTDFRASGADTSLGSVVTEAVRTDLGESSVVSLVAPSSVSAALGRMRRSEASRLDLALARELAQREGIKAVVDGDLRQLGTGFILTLRLVGAERGDELAAYHETVDSPRELIPTVDKLTRKLRDRIGESLKAVRASPPLEEVTTSSLEALKKYVAGARANDIESDFPQAIGLLQEAVSLDTTFAMAYRKLGVALGNNGLQGERVNAALTRAYSHRDRLTERERLLATGSYFDNGPGGDRQQAASAYAALLARDSIDDIAVTNFAQVLVSRREFVRAESLYQRLITSGRAGGLDYAGLVLARIAQGKLADAEAGLARARAALPLNPSITPLDASLLYARGWLDSSAQRLMQVRSGDRDPENIAWATYRLADLEMLRGRLATSEHLASDATAQDVARGAPPPPLSRSLDSAWIDIWFREQPRRGAERLDALLGLTTLRSLKEFQRPYLRAASLYALAARPERARALLAQYAVEVRDSALIRQQGPERHNALAEVALAERRPLDAVAEFRLGDRRLDGPANPCTACLPANLGRAYDLASLPDSAIANYERYLRVPRILWSNGDVRLVDASVRAGAHKRLGELYEAKKHRERAVGHYLQFIELWRNADRELQPKVDEVKQRLARLQDSERR